MERGRTHPMLLRRTFKNRVISNRFPELFNCGWTWPPYSPDLNPCDFYLWGYLKDRVYRRSPRTIPELKVEIEKEMRGNSNRYVATSGVKLRVTFGEGFPRRWRTF